MTTMQLTDFLLARIAEDEAVYRGAMHMGCVEDDSDGPNVIHSATCPNRVLAECDAKRRIVERHEPLRSEHVHARAERCAECGGNDWRPDAMGVLEVHPWAMPWPCPTLRLLALPYAGHPAFREEWRP
jgi:hypothetical protein